MTNDRAISRFLGHVPHSTCGSSDGLALYDNELGITGYCFACGEWVPQDKAIAAKGTILTLGTVSLPEDKAAEIANIRDNYKSLALDDRGLTKITADYFGVRVGVSQQNGITIVEHYYPYFKDNILSGYKKRNIKDKTFYAIGVMKGTELFGQKQARATGAKKLIITEGECDAMAIWQVLVELSKGTEYEKYTPAVVSVKSGASGAMADLAAQQDFLNLFAEIIICFDNDTPGQKATEAVSSLFPTGKVKIAKLSEKDANDMLRKGKAIELKKALLFQAQAYRPQGIISALDVFDSARQKAQWGISWPWPSLTRLTFGIRRREMIGVGAGTGIGKTNYWHQLIEHLTVEHSLRVGLFMLEEPPSKTLKMVAGKFAKIQFHDPSITYTQDQLDSALHTIDPLIILYKHEGDKTWADIKQAIRFMVLVEGCKDIIIDPLSALTYQVSASAGNDLLNEIMGDLAGLVQQLDFTLYYSSHLNPPTTGAPHEEGGRVKEMQFTGSRAMIKWSNYILGLERNKQADDEIERNTTICRLLKDREHGNAGTFLILYNKLTGAFLEPTHQQPEGVKY